MAADFARRTYPPGLFDLPQDLTRGLPLDLVERWVSSDQSAGSASALLAPTVVEGTTVVSDAAGLTLLTKHRGLIEMLALINRPKELIHAWGKAIGGEPIGIWAADNTQMWYSTGIGSERVLAMLLGVRDTIVRDCEVWVGFGAHRGRFYSIAGGLYGPEADGIELVAENYTEGGDVLLTRRMADTLPPGHGFSLASGPPDAPATAAGEIMSLESGPRLEGVAAEDTAYPSPWSQDFYADIVAYQKDPGEPILQSIEQRYTREGTVVLVEWARREGLTSEAELLENLALSVLLRKLSREVMGPAGTEIKVGSMLGIYLFGDSGEAVRFAKHFRAELARLDIGCRIGVDHGPVLACELRDGGKDISGGPVNIASKMAQDAGRMNRIYLSKAVA